MVTSGFALPVLRLKAISCSLNCSTPGSHKPLMRRSKSSKDTRMKSFSGKNPLCGKVQIKILFCIVHLRKKIQFQGLVVSNLVVARKSDSQTNAPCGEFRRECTPVIGMASRSLWEADQSVLKGVAFEFQRISTRFCSYSSSSAFFSSSFDISN